jgi:ATP-dependent Zn protease
MGMYCKIKNMSKAYLTYTYAPVNDCACNTGNVCETQFNNVCSPNSTGFLPYTSDSALSYKKGGNCPANNYCGNISVQISAYNKNTSNPQKQDQNTTCKDDGEKDKTEAKHSAKQIILFFVFILFIIFMVVIGLVFFARHKAKST